jgi:hypothetical protein
MRKIAVAFIHGVEIDDPGYADTAIRLLRERFALHAGGSEAAADDLLAIRPVYWAGVTRTAQKELLSRLLGTRGESFFARLRWLVTRLNAGVQAALVPFGLAILARSLPGVGQLHYPALRWVAIDFVGDAIAYQISPGERRVYDAIHAEVATTLGDLAAAAGEDAPLCIIAHSLGTVIASNYLYDLQTERAGRKRLVPTTVRTRMRATPLERGETLAHLYTMGSPLALWTLRYPDFGVPIAVPSPHLEEHHPGVAGEWVNFYDQDDLVAYPLKPLSDAYARAVTADCDVRLRGLLSSWNPLVHPWYWNDGRVIDPIARTLARTSKQLNGAHEPAAKTA